MRRCHWVATVLSVSLLAPVLPAGASVMTYLGTGLTSNVKLHAPGYLGDGLTVRAGEYLVRYEGADYTAYCVDIDAHAGSSEVTVQPVTALTNGTLVAYLFETYAPTVATGVQAAGLGVAIWELLYETPGNPFDPNHGDFHISGNSAVAAQAAGLLAGLPAGHTPDPATVVLVSAGKQDMLVCGHIPVPEPMAASVLLGGLPLALARWRRG